MYWSLFLHRTQPTRPIIRYKMKQDNDVMTTSQPSSASTSAPASKAPASASAALANSTVKRAKNLQKPAKRKNQALAQLSATECHHLEKNCWPDAKLICNWPSINSSGNDKTNRTRRKEMMKSRRRSCLSLNSSASISRDSAVFLLLLSSLVLVSSISATASLNPSQLQHNHNDNTARTRRHLNLEETDLLAASPHSEPLSSFEGSSSSSSSSSQAADYQQQQQQRSKRTLYACEEKQLQIECQRGEYIEVVRANYGRFSIQICNEHGQLDWKVNCMSQTSLDIVKESCRSKQSCQLLASNAIFGDACPGTQKYLEVHYQCKQLSAQVNASRPLVSPQAAPTTAASSQATAATTTSTSSSSSSTTTTTAAAEAQPGGRTASAKQANSSSNNNNGSNNNNYNVIQPTNEQSDKPNQPTRQQQQQPVAGWFPNGAPPSLPDWMPSVSPQPLPAPPIISVRPPVYRAQPAPPNQVMCPEIVWRQIRWPPTEPGQLARMPCPSHAHSLESPHSAASLACLAGGQWARRLQAARCQSAWLRNLSQRLEQGDSALSIAAELVQRTRPAGGQQTGWPINSNSHSHSNSQAAGLFGYDLANLSRVVRRTVDSMADLLNRIQDDKQRLGFAREMVQSLVELISNLSLEPHLDAWLDLDEQAGGERQRIAGQLVQSLESASVLLASTLTAGPRNGQQQQQQQEDSFIKTSESAYVSVRQLNLPASGPANRSMEVAFPAESGLFGTSWMSSQPQKFTLHLQTSSVGSAPLDGQTTPQDQSGDQNLKIVFVMLKGIGAQMEQPQPQQLSASAESQEQATNNRLVVNSNLVSFSIVADPRYTIKVDLSAPIELVFKHLEPLADSRPLASAPHCVYWDIGISGWMSDGCKLVDSNRTHSTCACTHLTTFGLLTSSDDLLHTQNQESSQEQQQQQQRPHQQQPAARVQLESVESGILLPVGSLHLADASPSSSGAGFGSYKLLYLIKMLNGHLFESVAPSASPSMIQPRPLVCISCLISAAMLALHLVAVAYNRAHARRLLKSMPASPPQPLLVSSAGQQPNNNARPHQLAVRPAPNGSSLETTPTYGSNMEPTTATTVSADHYLKQQQQQSSARFEPIGAGHHHAAPVSATSFKRQFQVPVHVLVQLLLLQLLLILLVESQNYIRDLSLSPSPSLGPSVDWRNSIGSITWLLVLALYYLVGSLTFWLLGQLVRLNLGLASLSLANLSSAASSSSSDWSSSQSKQQQQQQLASIFAPSSIASTQSRDSPTDSTEGVKYGGAGAQTIYGGQQRAATMMNLYGVNPVGSPASLYYGATDLQQRQQPPGSSNKPPTALLGYLLNPSIGRPLQLFLVHLCPCIFVTFIVWLSAPRVAWFNSLTYTTSFALQFVYWPLLVELIANTAAQSVLLYYIPAMCVVLFGWAMLSLRNCSKHRQEQLRFDSIQGQQDFISNEAANLSCLDDDDHDEADSGPTMHHNHSGQHNNQQHHQPHHHHREGSAASMRKSAPAANCYGSSTLVHSQQQQPPPSNRLEQPQIANALALNKQQQPTKKKAYCSDNRRALQRWQANDLKKAKFVCTILLALLVLHSICWLSFFAHIHRALNLEPGVQLAQSWWLQGWLMYAFASSNLALVLLIGWSQRRTLRRSAQLTGLTRLLGCLAGLCGSADRTSMAASAARRRARLYQRAVQQSSLQLKSAASSAAPMKMSPSNQSLFLVSQRHQQQQHHLSLLASQSAIYQQPTYGYSTSGRHLQLAGAQQHIYDSTSALNGGPSEPLNVMQLMHQQQQLQQQQQQQQQHRQEQFATMHAAGRSVQPFHLQQQHGRLPMTLRPVGFESRQQLDLHHPQLMLDGAQVCQQQQQHQSRKQQTGEADGPLVAFSSCSSSSTSTDSSQQQQATFGPHLTSSATPATNQTAARLPSGPQLFDCQQQQQHPQCSRQTSVPAAEQQHQYYSINSPPSRLPQQQQQQQQHFRRSDSRQSRQQQMLARQQQHFGVHDPASTVIDGRAESNIYDVANYALIP